MGTPLSQPRDEAAERAALEAEDAARSAMYSPTPRPPLREEPALQELGVSSAEISAPVSMPLLVSRFPRTLE